MSETLDKTLKVLNKMYPETRIHYLTDQVMNRDTISTGSLKLDLALGGGMVKGRVIEIIGPEASGKTTLALHMMVEAQRNGVVVYIDTEHALNPSLAQSLGVDLSRFIIMQPDYAEQAFEVIEALIETGEVSMVVLDSVAGLSPKAEMDGEAGDSNMGLIARLLGQHLRKVIPLANRHKANVIYINQIRYKIGVMFGNPETTSGGNALKFFASGRLDIRKKEALKEKGDDSNIVGIKSRVKVIKNKMAVPFKECEVNFIFNKGIDNYFELAELAIEHKIVEKSGTWFSYKGETVAQGKEQLRDYLVEHKETAEEIRTLIFGDKNEAPN